MVMVNLWCSLLLGLRFLSLLLLVCGSWSLGWAWRLYVSVTAVAQESLTVILEQPMRSLSYCWFSSLSQQCKFSLALSHTQGSNVWVHMNWWFLSMLYGHSSVGCIVLYTGQAKFHSSTTKTLNYVVSQADTTVESLRNLSGYLGAAKRIGVDSVFLPSDVQSNIDTTITKLNSAATKLSNTTEKNSKRIDDGHDSM